MCWGSIQLRMIMYTCKSLWCNGLCIVLNIEGGLLLGSETYSAKASLSDPEGSMNVCNIMQRIVCHIFLPLFSYCFLHIIMSVFSSVQAWGIKADELWTGHQWQHLPPCLLATDWNQWLYLNLQQQSVWSCLDLLEKRHFFFSTFSPYEISKGVPNSLMAYVPHRGEQI